MRGPRQVLFVQGGGAGAHDDWDALLVASLTRELGDGYEVRYPQMPTEDDPSPRGWGPAIRREVEALDAGAVVVGHSVGAVILLNGLTTWSPLPELGAIVLVAAPFVGPCGWSSTELELPEDLGRRLPPGVPVHVFHGSDDETAPVAHAQLYAKALPHAEVHVLARRDHQLGNDLSEVAGTIRTETAGSAGGATAPANGVELGIESFGRADDPLVLLAGGPTMLSWPDSVCERLASGRRRVVRYDLRDCGASTTVDPGAPDYTLRDLADDAAALVGALGATTAHLAGLGVGGMVAQVAALDHPGTFSALTLVSTRPVAPGPVDDDLPEHDAAVMAAMFARPMPDWSDRAAVGTFAADGARLMGNDPAQARATTTRIWDRTASSEPSVHLANQLGTVFARLDCRPRWRERLGELSLPTLVVHGRDDPFFPVGNGEALAAAIPGARLLVVEGMGPALPDRAADEVATAMLRVGPLGDRA